MSDEPSVWDPWMLEALAWARLAERRGDVPIAALVVLDGQIIGRGFNTREAEHDPSGHAEIVALRDAGRRVQRWRMDGATLVVTLEPCVMCAGAIVNSRIARVVYGAADPKAGAVDSLYQVLQDRRLNHQVEVISGVQASACQALLKEFFTKARAKKKKPSPKTLRGYEHTAHGCSHRHPPKKP